MGSLVVLTRSSSAAAYAFAQYHNQTTDGPLHIRLVEMWKQFAMKPWTEVETQVFAGSTNFR